MEETRHVCVFVRKGRCVVVVWLLTIGVEMSPCWWCVALSLNLAHLAVKWFPMFIYNEVLSISHPVKIVHFQCG